MNLVDEIQNEHSKMDYRYKQLIRQGCRRDISIEQRIQIRKELTRIRRRRKEIINPIVNMLTDEYEKGIRHEVLWNQIRW